MIVTECPCAIKVLDKCVYDWCKEEYLPPGFVFGEKPPAILTNAGWIVFGIMALGVLINHFIHNRGKFVEVNFND
jgi:hypothetical protein